MILLLGRTIATDEREIISHGTHGNQSKAEGFGAQDAREVDGTAQDAAQALGRARFCRSKEAAFGRSL